MAKTYIFGHKIQIQMQSHQLLLWQILNNKQEIQTQHLIV